MSEITIESHSNAHSSQDQTLRLGLMISFGAHIVIFLSLIIRSVFFPSYQAAYYQPSIRVDMVGLPEKVDPRARISDKHSKPAPPEKVESPKPQPKQAETPLNKPEVKLPEKAANPKEINLTKSKQADAINKLKSMAALEALKKEFAKENESKSKNNEVTLPPMRGNVVNPGASLTGLDKLQHDSYVEDVESHAKEHWIVPEWLSKKKLMTTVRVKIDRNGQLLAHDIIKSSGNPSYDEAVFAVIEKSIPFPKPPEKFVQWMAVNGIVIEFGSNE